MSAVEVSNNVKKSLVELESVIERGQKTFVEVGNALLEIRERRLYREQGHTTFENYCQKRWGWSRDYGYKLIRSAEVLQSIDVDNCLHPPQTESQARELVPIMRHSTTKVTEVWEDVQRRYGTNATAENVRSVVQEYLPQEESAPSQPSLEEREKMANKMEAEELGLSQVEWDALPDSYIGECYKQCYTACVMIKGTVYEYGVRGVYVCTGCGYQYPPKHQPDICRIPDQSEESIQSSGNVYQPIAATVFSSRSEEYDTPIHILDTARNFLGGIDLDPASNDDAQRNVRAKAYYTKDTDGLAQPWNGSVWLNPPYGKTGGQSNQEIWANRLIEEYQRGNVTEALLLVKAALGYNWFEALFREWPVCFVRNRLSFILDDGDDSGQSKQGTAIFYFGPRMKEFAKAFLPLGRIIPPEEMVNAILS